MTWKMKICCDMMQESMDYDQVRISEDIGAWLPLHNGSCSIDYCPWCGKKIRFRKVEE
ncbi:MAG: hypothetical protein IKN41_04820 [Candidatus Methanomethylophilaceae archaeon]|nr:hypothetical protein [Candidatus Methanomethylophilaceae archaeon]